ncbi:MAG: glycosyltransferase [Leptolyngbyaceae cyanobacterium RM2_2_4]|nr:glycosyltransferase [Leptolyngbyaceae cyanobacterium RM2_2_4]
MEANVSLIMPVYNGERYLSEAIQSVLSQTLQNFELMIWNDGSEDASLDIALGYARHDSRVRVISEKHQGIAASFNAAVAQASGSYIGCIDSDDLLVPTTLEETKLVLETHSEFGLVYTDYIVIDERGRERKYGGRCTIPYSKEKLLENFMTFHFRLFRKEAFEQIGGIDESLEYAVDYDLCLKLSEITDFVHLAKPLYHYRSHADNVSHQKRDQQSVCAAEALSEAKRRRGVYEDLSQSFQFVDASQSKVKSLRFHWSPTKQLYACDDIFFKGQGLPPTEDM